MGLWLVLWVVSEYGGAVRFEDRDDGTTVILRLPLASEEAQSAHRTPEQPPRAQSPSDRVPESVDTAED